MDNPNGAVHFKKVKEITINILDVNNNYPIFQLTLYEFSSITENEVIGYLIGEVQATDKDFGENANITYKLLLKNDADIIIMTLFKVQKVNDKAQILVNSSLKNKGGRYTFIIMAMDNGVPQFHNNCTVVVTVIDFNDYSPNITNPVLPNNGSIPQFSIFENTIGIVTVITAFDNDTGINGEIRFNLNSLNGDHEFFFISPVSGNLSNIRSFDRETKDLYKFRVVAYDLGLPSRSSFVDIEVLVMDVDDNLPQFPFNNFTMTLYTFEGTQIFYSINNSSRNGFKIGNVATAIDKDIGENAIIIYILIGNTIAFYLDPFSGDLFGLIEFDRESIASYEAIVKAIPKSQFGKGPYPNLPGYSLLNCSESKLVVIIMDINDNPPVFTSQTILGGIIQTAFPGTPVLDLSKYVTDKDTVSQNFLVFSIEYIFPIKADLAAQLKNLNIDTMFVLNSTTGILYTAPGFLFQDNIQGFIQMKVSVSDGKFKNSCQCIIYFIGSNQQVITVIQNYPDFVVKMTNDFIKYMSSNLNVTIAADSIELFKDVRGNVPSGLTNLYIHAINFSSNTVMNGSDLLFLINQIFPKLTDLVQKYQVLEFKLPTSSASSNIDNANVYKSVLIVLVCSFIVLLVIIIASAWICRSKYQRKLKAYCTSSIDSAAVTNNVKLPGTNMYEKAINPLSNVNQENNSNYASPKRGNKNKKIGVPVYGNEIKFDEIFTDISCSDTKNIIENTESIF